MNPHKVTVWDPLVRFSHWVLAVSFAVAYVTEDEWLTAHVWAGYTVGALVAARIVWGFVGPRHARFTDFLYAPRVILRYGLDLARWRAPRYVGHSPAGGAMVVLLLISLSVTVVSGLVLYAQEEHAGPLAGIVAHSSPPNQSVFSIIQPALADDGFEHEFDEYDRFANTERWEELHEISSEVTLFLVLLHIAGVVWASLAHRENLIKAMIDGNKRET